MHTAERTDIGRSAGAVFRGPLKPGPGCEGRVALRFRCLPTTVIPGGGRAVGWQTPFVLRALFETMTQSPASGETEAAPGRLLRNTISASAKAQTGSKAHNKPITKIG